MNSHLAISSYHALQTGVTKRFGNRWQANATYTLSGLWSADTKPFSDSPAGRSLDRTADLGGEWGLSSRRSLYAIAATSNGIWQVGHGFQVSGLHFFAASIRQNNIYAGDHPTSAGVVSTASFQSGWHDSAGKCRPGAAPAGPA